MQLLSSGNSRAAGSIVENAANFIFFIQDDSAEIDADAQSDGRSVILPCREQDRPDAAQCCLAGYPARQAVVDAKRQSSTSRWVSRQLCPSRLRLRVDPLQEPD